jgi:signal recognition particle GTPase
VYGFVYDKKASPVTIAQRVKHFLAEMEKEDLRFLSEEQIVDFLKMSQKERDAYAARGEHQKIAMAYYTAIVNKMTSIESQERETGKTSKVLRLLSNSGGKHNVDELKTIRKEYGAQSKEYKNALTTLEK